MGERPPSRNGRDEVGEQPLDSSFVFVNAKNYRKYFKKGKIFRTLWPEPANSTEQHRDGIVDIGKSGEQMYVKIHWFVVVQTFTGHCLAVPVHTYDGRGATKSGISIDDHCALVAKGQSPVMLDGEQLNRAPLHLILENPNIRLKSSSRINFSKVHAVEYNIKINTVGRIAPEDVPTLGEYWYQSMTKARGETTSGAHNSRTVRLGKQMVTSNVKRSSTNHQKSAETAERTTPTSQEATYSTELADNQHSGDWQSIDYQEASIAEEINPDWLTSTEDYSSHHEIVAKVNQPGTAEWLSACPKYQNWRESFGEILFCPGLSGSRKTALTAIVVDDLHSRFSNDQSVGICYLYSGYRLPARPQLPQLVSSFVKQLLQKYRHFSSLISKMDDRLEMFGAIVAKLVRTFIVVDALDELDSSGSSDQTLVKGLLHLQARHKLNFLGTSRFVPHVTKLFEGSPTLEIRLKEKHSVVDIYTYLDSQKPKLPEFVRKSSELQREIAFRIWYAAGGIYLLAQTFVQYLVSNFAEMSAEAIRNALKSLGTSSSALDSAWHDSIARVIDELVNRQELAKDVFMWVTCAQRPLTISELQHALAVDTESKCLRPDKIPSLESLLSACVGFVGIEKVDGTINLTNASVKTFLTQNHSQWFPDAHKTIADICATYLFLDDFSTGCVQSEEERQWRVETFPFYSYACWNWWHHAQSSSAIPYFERLNASPAHLQAWYQSVLYSASGPTLSREVYLGPGHISMLHIAAFLDQDTVIDWLLYGGFCDVGMRDEQGRTPIFYAARRGSLRALKRLLERGADMEAKDASGETPLLWAVREGQEDIARFLLENGANRRESESALSLASEFGLSITVELLLKNAAFADVQHATRQKVSLHAAVMKGDTTVVEFLLQGSANHQSSKLHGQNELLYASRMGFESIVKLLIKFSCIDIGAPDQIHSRSALSWAAEGGFVSIIKLLLNQGANAQSRNKFDQTPLFFAADAGHAQVVRMLLEKKVAPDSRDTFNQTPLCRAQLKRDGNTQSYDDIILSLGSGRRPLCQCTTFMDEGICLDLCQQSSEFRDGNTDMPALISAGGTLEPISLDEAMMDELISQAVWPEKAFVRFLFDYDDSALHMARKFESPEVPRNPRDAEQNKAIKVPDRQGHISSIFPLTQLKDFVTPTNLKRAVLDDEFFDTRSGAARITDPLVSGPLLHDRMAGLLQEFADSIPHKHQRRIGILNAIGLFYGARYQEAGGLANLRKAISIFRNTMEELGKTDSRSHLEHEGIGSRNKNNQVVLLTNLGIHLEHLYRRTANVAHLDEAVQSLREAINASSHSVDQGHLMRILGQQLRDRYAKVGDKLDLDEAIELTRQAVESLPAEPSTQRDRIGLLNNLASMLTDRFTNEKTWHDGDEALSLMKVALQTLDHTLVEEPLVSTGRAAILNNLGSLHANLFWRSGDKDHLETAVKHTKDAWKDAPKTSIEHSVALSHLAILHYQYYESGEMGDRLAQAVNIARRAAKLAEDLPDNPSKAAVLHNLGSLLFRKYKVEQMMRDLDEAVAWMRKAVGDTLRVHTDHRMIFDHLILRFGTKSPAMGAFQAADKGMDRPRWYFKSIEPDTPEYAMLECLEAVSSTRHAATMPWMVSSSFPSWSKALATARSERAVSKEGGGKNQNYKAMFEKLLHALGAADLTEAVKAAAGSQEYGEKALKLLFNERGHDLQITEEVVRAAAGNRLSGDKVMKLLLSRGLDKTVLTENVVRAAIQNEVTGMRIFFMLFRELERGTKRKRDISDGVDTSVVDQHNYHTGGGKPHHKSTGSGTSDSSSATLS